ncbi:MAG TPA: ATP-binding protein [Solirubrobacteraceae bacterium]|nr:ATP-binding protein [Solirubrobacteraceae bacterium]
MESPARMRLELSSRAENVPLVRQSLSGLAEAIGLRRVELNDVLTAVTEACNNVSLHAYGGREGPLAVELLAGESGIVVSVRDSGVGLALDADMASELPTGVDHGLGGLGLPVIRALAAESDWSEPAGGGTEVRMRFATQPLASQWTGPACDLGVPPATEAARASDAIVAAMAPLAVARAVLPRLMQALAARLHFSIERHEDIRRFMCALLGEPANWAAPAEVRARLLPGADSLRLAVGPLTAQAASRLSAQMGQLEPTLVPSVAPLGDAWHELHLSIDRFPVADIPRGAG